MPAASVESALYDHLSNDTNVAAFVGAAPNSAIYSIFSPQVAGGGYPLITFQRISADHVRSMEGSSGLAEARMQLNCAATTQLQAIGLFDAVRLSLDGFKGIMGTPSSGNELSVGACFLESEGDLPEMVPSSAAQRVYVRRMDFTIWYAEVQPTFS